MSIVEKLAAAFRDMPSHEYHAHPALSCSQLLACGLYDEEETRWTPQRYVAAGADDGDGDEDRSAALDLGTVVHAGYYEPLTLSSIYAVRPMKGDRIAPTNSREYAEWALSHPGKIHLHPKDDDRAMTMLATLNGATQLDEYRSLNIVSREKCYFVTCPHTGLELRIKPDCLRINRTGILINEDLKTTRKGVDPVQMRHTCYDLNYFRRFAWYRYVLELITGQRCISTLLAVQSTNPHEAAQYILNDADLDAAEAQNFAAQAALAKCIETGNFQPKWKREITVL
jgi:PDDEXK-like domain of unknown function (DUF3799)